MAAPLLIGRVVSKFEHVDYDGNVVPWPNEDWDLPRHVRLTFTDGSRITFGGACYDESRVDIDFEEPR